ncbi:MAG: 4-hydroxy-tetrahydrodipicolinate synthase [Proteobacteria bacterium]|nr:4-hydroxy-tetrahydrodipicolinate synthase [Pseudomonadota bacterium]
MFKGSMVALVTPFSNGKIDEKGLRKLVKFHMDNGTDVICPCGTTGEAATLSLEEHEAVVNITMDAAGGKIPVLAGTGSNNTEEAIRLTRHAARAGVAGCLHITPYYNRPTQEGLVAHFKKIADAVSIPIVLYNVPGRTGVNMLPETVARLAEIPTIVGIKEASGSLSQVSEIINLCRKDFNVVSGDDVNTLPIMAVGGKGVISVTANIAPRLVSSMVRAFEEGRLEEAQKLHHHLLPLHNSMFLQTNPIPVKTALGMMGMISSEMRLPLCPMPAELDDKLKKILKKYQLVE